MSGRCGYLWEDPEKSGEDCGYEHECIMVEGDGHTQHECACGEEQENLEGELYEKSQESRSLRDLGNRKVRSR